MGKIRDFFINTFGRKKQEQTAEHRMELRTIITDMYGGNIGLFARTYASSLYNIPEVRTAIETYADIFSTIPRYFERIGKDGNITYLENAASRVINLKPNPLQNATQFWKNLVTELMLYNNVFVEPSWDVRTGQLKSLYVLPHMQHEFNLYGERATVTFLNTGKTYDLDDIIYINRFPTLTGGSKNNIGLYETVIHALAEQAIAVADPQKARAILQSASGQSGNIKQKDKEGALKDLEGNFDKTVRGMVYFDPQWKITPINWQENDVNRELMKFIVNIVYNYFGMDEEIINNNASEIKFQMFVKTKMEPPARQVEQEFTYKLFTAREIEVGNRLELDTFNLSVSTLAAKTQFFNVVGRSGVMNIDEQREMVGLPPLPNGLGQMYRVTADTVNIEIVDDYQKSKNGVADKNKSPEGTDAA